MDPKTYEEEIKNLKTNALEYRLLRFTKDTLVDLANSTGSPVLLNAALATKLNSYSHGKSLYSNFFNEDGSAKYNDIKSIIQGIDDHIEYLENKLLPIKSDS